MRAEIARNGAAAGLDLLKLTAAKFEDACQFGISSHLMILDI
ncbi:MAG: hypothetical protein ACRD3W_19070 [Terriglobales bacterium]